MRGFIHFKKTNGKCEQTAVTVCMLAAASNDRSYRVAVENNADIMRRSLKNNLCDTN